MSDDLRIDLMRNPTNADTTFGSCYLDGMFFCFTLEDAVREKPGEPVSDWKIKGKTAIPEGKYSVGLVDSPRFGPGSVHVQDVEGFSHILFHSGETVDDTQGCIILGDMIYQSEGRISGGRVRGILDGFKKRVTAAIEDGKSVSLYIVNS